MADLSNWDFAGSFLGRQAASLIIGIDPGNVSDNQKHRIEPVLTAILASYLPPMHHPDSARESLAKQEYGQWIFSVQLTQALSFDETNSTYKNWKAKGMLQFDEQAFDRHEIIRWLDAREMKSVYQFDRKQSTMLEVDIETAIDPADLPDELHAANIAFRAVTNGHGDPLSTFKNRLIGYLETNFPDLSNDAVKRIATVSNPDKTTGRKKSNTE